ncbi:MAG TPA: hypothetical protein VF575_00380 [Candidatus Saccharimonadales bacterium]|jgi:hypothetical protein
MNREQGTIRQLPEIKDQDANELFARLVSNEAWTPQDQIRITEAFCLAAKLHIDDTHRAKPYVYHVLRVANRLASPDHLDRPDADLVIAALLHDCVEDHAERLIELLPRDVQLSEPLGRIPLQQTVGHQAVALIYIARGFGQNVASLVGIVTNPPDMYRGLTGAAKTDRYAEKVAEVIVHHDAWFLKFADFIDNAVGIIHSVGEDPVKIEYRKAKYLPVIAILEARFYEPDIQAMLSPAARQYAYNKLNRAKVVLAA